MAEITIPLPSVPKTITLYHIAKVFLYASILSVVIVMSSTFFPFIGGKYYFFRFTVEMAMLFLVLWWGFEAPRGYFDARFTKLFRQPLFIAVSAFVLSVMLSTLFADNPYGAFWSNYERGEGSFQMLHYYAFFVLLALLLERASDWKLAFQLTTIAAVLMIAYGLAAALFVNGFIGPYNAGEACGTNIWCILFLSNNRFQGSLGNPAYVAPYLLFAMFYALYLYLAYGHSVATKKYRRYRMVGYGFLLLLFLTFFVLSQTRGAFLGLGGGVMALIVYLFITEKRLRKNIAILFFVGLATLTTLVYFRDTLVANNIPANRILFMSLSDSSAQTRIWTWSSALRGSLERPIFGWGPENFSTVFDKFFDTRHYEAGRSTETWFDRAHSVFFEHLSTLGFVGITAYLSIFFIFYLQFFRLRRAFAAVNVADEAIGKRRTNLLRGLALGLITAYLVQNLILFDVLPIYLMLFLFLAFALYEFDRSSQESPRVS